MNVLLCPPYRRTIDVRIRAVVQAGSEVVQVRLVRQRQAAEVPHTGGDGRRSLALLSEKGPQLQLRTAQREHVRREALARCVRSIAG